MLTVKRNEFGGYSDTAVLEREDSVLDYQLEDAPTAIETPEETRARKSRNLDKIMNFEKYKVEEERLGASQKLDELIRSVDGVQLTAREDLSPSSTTMQFKNNKSAEDFYESAVNEEKFTFKLNTRGKLLIAAYAVVVAIILAFIILNTGIINSIQNKLSEKEAVVENLQSTYAQIEENIKEVSSDEYVINKAVNEYNMSK